MFRPTLRRVSENVPVDCFLAMREFVHSLDRGNVGEIDWIGRLDWQVALGHQPPHPTPPLSISISRDSSSCTRAGGGAERRLSYLSMYVSSYQPQLSFLPSFPRSLTSLPKPAPVHLSSSLGHHTHSLSGLRILASIIDPSFPRWGS